MADDYVQVPVDDAGKKLQTYSNVIGANTVHAEAVVLVDANGDENPAQNVELIDRAARLVGNVQSNNLNLATEATLGTVHGHVDSIDGKITACNTGAIAGAVDVTDAFALEATQGEVNGHAHSIDGKITACNTGAVVLSSGTVTTVTNVVHVDDNASTISVDGALTQSTKHDAATYKVAFFNAAADGNIIAAVANKVLKIHAIAVQADGTVTVNIRNDVVGGTILMTWTLQAREGAVMPFASYPAYWLITAQGKALYCDVTAAVATKINVIYTDADAA